MKDRNADVQLVGEVTHETTKAQLNISNRAITYVSERRYPPIKIEYKPKVIKHEEGTNQLKDLLNRLEKGFRKKNPRYSQPFGFDHFQVDANGDLICYTNALELLIYLCDVNNYPTELTTTQIRPTPPTKLPAQHALILKFIDNKTSLEEVKENIEGEVKSLYYVGGMTGTKTYRARHIRIDILDKEEYTTILNNGVLVVGGHLYNVEEFLPSPRVMICQRCNFPGHMKRNCTEKMDKCGRCGLVRTNAMEHRECPIKCRHCGGEHEATSYKCSLISS